MTNNDKWAEPLPDACPPQDAFQPDNAIFYRLVANNPPQDQDFWSQRKLYPEKQFNANECIARALSLMKALDDCEELRKLPSVRNKKIIKITLPPWSGLIKKTGRYASHYSWWRAGNFDPLSASEIIEI